jgi:hypothetical protein
MKIFISYRRADSKYVVDRIRDRLIAAFGEESIFRDIESIPLGKDFRTVLESETGGCNVMLVVIGQQWLNITDAHGNKRLFDQNDFTRIEVETGLQRDGVLVIPVLVMGMEMKNMPTAMELPESLSSLAFRNAIEVRDDPDFDHDMQRLISNIKPVEIPNREYFEPRQSIFPKGIFGWELHEGKESQIMRRHSMRCFSRPIISGNIQSQTHNMRNSSGSKSRNLSRQAWAGMVKELQKARRITLSRV